MKKRLDIRPILIIFIILLIIYGILNKEYLEVLKNAVLICFSCIGID
ncbi:MAG: CD1871A family CXXC motif-containing protein [Caldisericia bacterium]